MTDRIRLFSSLALLRARPSGASLPASAGLERPIQTLLGDNKLRTEGQKRGTRYFAGGGRGGKAKAAKAAPRKAAKRKSAEKTAKKA